MVATSLNLQATWYGEGVENGADITMMDLRWPWWPSGTYYANWNSGVNPKPNDISFYAGFTSFLADGPGCTPNPDEKLQEAFRPGSVWSFWGGDKEGNPVRFVDVAPNLCFKNAYGGEGCNASLHSEPWSFIQCKRWYTMLGRVWQPTDPKANHSFIGRWIKDVENGRWHLIGIARLPVQAKSFTGNSGFIETLSDVKVVRPLDRRFGYFRKDGTWRKSDVITINKTQYVVLNVLPEGDHEYIGIEYAAKPDLLPQRLKGTPIPGNKDNLVRMKQPDLPTLDKPEVKNVKAECTDKQVAVSWEIPETFSPAFAYKIEVFDNPECQGAPKAIAEERLPSARRAIVDAAVKTPTVRLTVSDVFDQPAPPVTVTATATKLLPAPNAPAKTISGLSYELCQSAKKPGGKFWQTLGELKDGKPVRQGLARGLDLSVRESLDAGYAMVFSGLLRASEDGIYIFYGQIDGAYSIQIDGQDVIVRDEQAGTTEHAGFCRLSKGDHAFKVTYLYGRLNARNFNIDWEGPHLPRQTIPVEALFIADDGAYPKPEITSVPFGDGTGRVTLTVDARGHTVNKAAIYLGNFQIAESNGAEVKYEGPLPKGTNTFWCRVVYDGNRSVDINSGALDVTGKPYAPAWTVRNIGEQGALAGLWQTGPDAFTFFGNGMHAVVKSVTGDFTATCRVDSYSSKDVNGRAWVGIAAIENTTRINWNWGQSFYLVQTARDGKRSSPDSDDLGGGRISSYPFPQNHPWVRIARQGNIWTAWTSADGKQWELGGYQVKQAPKKMDVGLFISAIQQDARAYYNAKVSELSVQSGLLPECVPPPPVAAKNTAGDRLTGVVMARSDENTVVVRSTSQGLLRTTDGGKTWSAINGDLTGAANAVRGVAIHPTNPAIMLRAAGRAMDGKSEGGLWKTTDGGKTWKKLSFEGDFDGTGPSALCGEVIAFDLKDTETVYVGTESKGCFKSTDGGATWTSLGVVGERITSVVVWPWDYVNPVAGRGISHLCVTTCPDKWMLLLGRGKPAITTTGETAKSYVSHDNIKSLKVFHAREDLGFYNVAFDRMCQSPDNMRYATSYGLQHNVGGDMFAFPEAKNVEWMRPFTAVYGACLPGSKNGRCIAQALDPANPERISVSQAWAFNWEWKKIHGSVPKGGLIAVTAEYRVGKTWWFVHTDGLYCSTDGSKALSRAMDASGR
ncbi:MAG: hypothetical protein NTW87_05670 [Planctomycetota bacterium]|nr:hypothetical protein [Planctomycetota bacterium]